MTGKTRLTEERLRTVLRRQKAPPWNKDYVPGILATRAEAPSISRAYILTPAKLGREAHALSLSERTAILLGLYHPDVIGLQEQRVLSTNATPHPLATMEGLSPISLAPLKGLLDASRRLGCSNLVPRIFVTDGATPLQKRAVPFPLFGDLLWAIRRSGGVYCVNWTIKDKLERFTRSSIPGTGQSRRDRPADQEVARHALERVFYEDAKIRTVQIGGDQIDLDVAANLHQLFLHHRRELRLTASQKFELRERFVSALATSVAPVDVIVSSRASLSIDEYDARSYLYQLIWYRHLRVDLFAPILIDRPLRPERRDVVDVYADWFKE